MIWTQRNQCQDMDRELNPVLWEPEPQGAGTFGRSRNTEVSAPGQTKVVY
jgi:hypothetical protein